MDPPSLDPPPDADYPAFPPTTRTGARSSGSAPTTGCSTPSTRGFGVEVWAFVPFNLLPKLRTLRDGQPVGTFAHFVDSSPKIADVKIDDEWHT